MEHFSEFDISSDWTQNSRKSQINEDFYLSFHSFHHSDMVTGLTNTDIKGQFKHYLD